MKRFLNFCGRHKKITAILCTIIIAFCFTCALCMPSYIDEVKYKAIAKDVKSENDSIIDWAALMKRNNDIVAWLKVDNTQIDYPVVFQNMEMGKDYYLHHDIDKEDNYMGCPVLDRRSKSTNNKYLLIYGHNVNDVTAMFSPLRDTWQQDSFNNLGKLTLSTPQNKDNILSPICALKVDANNQDVQQFDFENTEKLREHILSLIDSASAKSDNAKSIAKLSNKIVALCTCSSPIPNQRERTIVIYG